MGCFYIHGRDKFYRPCFVLDGGIIARINREDPDSISAEVFSDVFLYLLEYVKKVMFLPGHVE